MIVLLCLECGLLDVMAMKNCTQFNGTFFNHTCVFPGDVSADRYLEIQNLTQGIDHQDLIKSRKAPSDEYFQ